LAQSHDLTPPETTASAASGAPDAEVSTRALSRQRIWTARCIALAVDALQIALLPLVLGGALSPVNDALDIATAVVLSLLIGWHWSFLPAFVAEVLPFVDLVPSWTLAVLIATRGRRGYAAPRS
jgi:hypothetical protein